MQFYTYVWYDQDWIPYYVGKGVGCRSRKRRGIPHPEEGHVVLKYFDLEQDSFEHEKALIAFWGRREYENEGLLMNQTLGGPGSTGLKHSDATRAKMSASQQVCSRALKWLVISPQGETFSIKNLKSFCLKHSLSVGNMHKVANGVRKQHKGWSCRYA